jgi:nucleoside recognition membrane protein YjiH
MTENSEAPVKAADNRRNIWVRAIFMLLMVLAFHVCVTVLLFVTIIQFLIMLLNDTPNVRLMSFGRSMGSYLGQIANYLTFATEELPFPFSDWPAGG